MCAGRTGQLQHEIVTASNLKRRGLIIEPRAAVAADHRDRANICLYFFK